MTCSELRAQLTPWLRGALEDHRSRALEAHAAECLDCGKLVEAESRLPALVTVLAPPAELRARTLTSVARLRQTRRWRHSLYATAAMAAVVIFAIMIRPQRKSAADFPGAGAVLLAMKLAGPELQALDDAEKDVIEALAVHPTDADLTAALRRIQRQREALKALVEKVPE